MSPALSYHTLPTGQVATDYINISTAYSYTQLALCHTCGTDLQALGLKVGYTQTDDEMDALFGKLLGPSASLPFLCTWQLDEALWSLIQLHSLQHIEINANFILSPVCQHPDEYAKAFVELSRLSQITKKITHRYYYDFYANTIPEQLEITILCVNDLAPLFCGRELSNAGQALLGDGCETAQGKSGDAKNNQQYKHLSNKERYLIFAYRNMGMSQKQIAKMIDHSPSTISREVRRLDPGSYGPFAKYEPDNAQLDYIKKRQIGGYKGKIAIKNDKGELTTSVIRQAIKSNKLSPRQVSNGILKNLHQAYVSTATIYRWIKKNKIYDLSVKDLRRKGKKYKKCYDYSKKYEKGRDILQRPEHINNRSEFGHFEADSIVSPRNGSGRTFTLVERSTRFVFAKVTKEGTAVNFFKFIKEILYKYGNIFKSITVDRGCEFACWQELEKLGIQVYFCRPYNSNDKGQIEHMNGELRWFFPKSTDFSKISQKDLYNYGVKRLNNFPREVLGWRTSKQAFDVERARLAASA